MTTIEQLSRKDAEEERASLLARLRAKFGTDDRDELRELSLAGAMGNDDIGAVERLRSLDYLLGE